MMRITMNKGYLFDRLDELGWEAAHMQVMFDRIIALAESGEEYIDVCRRLNPKKQTFQPWEPSPFVPAVKRHLRRMDEVAKDTLNAPVDDTDELLVG